MFSGYGNINANCRACPGYMSVGHSKCSSMPDFLPRYKGYTSCSTDINIEIRCTYGYNSQDTRVVHVHTQQSAMPSFRSLRTVLRTLSFK